MLGESVVRFAKWILKAPERWGRSSQTRRLGKTALGRFFVDAVLWPYDWRLVSGSYSYVFGRKPRLLKPRSFNEHICSNKLFGRNRRQVELADKISARQYVTSRIGARYLNGLIWTGTDLRELDHESLPKQFVIKANHISGDIVICQDKSAFDWNAAQRRSSDWLEVDYSGRGGEWQYRWIQPRLLIEEFLQDGMGNVPDDLKFFCFDGRVKFVQVDKDRFTNHRRILLNPDFDPLPFGLCYPRFTGEVQRPVHFEEMKHLAESLAEGFKFVRVDFYDVGKPIFGEMTFHPGGGIEIFEPAAWDERLGHLFGHPEEEVCGPMP